MVMVEEQVVLFPFMYFLVSNLKFVWSSCPLKGSKFMLGNLVITWLIKSGVYLVFELKFYCYLLISSISLLTLNISIILKNYKWTINWSQMIIY